jgi:hypothetical protein
MRRIIIDLRGRAKRSDPYIDTRVAYDESEKDSITWARVVTCHLCDPDHVLMSVKSLRELVLGYLSGPVSDDSLGPRSHTEREYEFISRFQPGFFGCFHLFGEEIFLFAHEGSFIDPQWNIWQETFVKAFTEIFSRLPNVEISEQRFRFEWGRLLLHGDILFRRRFLAMWRSNLNFVESRSGLGVPDLVRKLSTEAVVSFVEKMPSRPSFRSMIDFERSRERIARYAIQMIGAASSPARDISLAVYRNPCRSTIVRGEDPDSDPFLLC